MPAIELVHWYSYLPTSVKTLEAVDHERHGTTATGLGHTPAASDAFCREKTIFFQSLVLLS